MHWTAFARAAPAATGAVALAAGAAQFSAWNRRHFACCRGTAGCADALAADAPTAWRHGQHLGVQCVRCCLGPTLVLLAIGMMDLRAMALVTAAISVERLAPGGTRAARLVGVVLIGFGLLSVAGAAVP